jgi:hypothetical protein
VVVLHHQAVDEVKVQVHHQAVDEVHYTHMLGRHLLGELVIKHVDDEHRLEQ